jgi:cysteine desulfurase
LKSLDQGILAELGDENVRLNGHPESRLPNTLSLSFRGVAANTLLAEISQEVAASAGSACHADQVTISAVLEAMKIPVEWAMGTVRFSVGRGTTPEDIERAIPIIVAAVRKQQKLSFAPET